MQTPLPDRATATPLPIMNEPTGENDSSARTLAMPMHQVTGQSLTRGGTNIMEMPRSIAALKGTVPLPSGAEPLAGSPPSSGQAMYAPAGPQPRIAQGPMPNVYDDVSSTSPPSQDKTTVYRPQTPPGQQAPQPRQGPANEPQQARAAAPLAAPAPGPAMVPAAGRRSAVPYVIGGFAFAVVGFAIVAMVLQYLRTGILPWR
jgi:hypothetical protein